MYAIIIPALQPDKALVSYVKELKSAVCENIVVVDDGSGADYESVFRNISMIEGCSVLTHETNQGKGVALKTAIRFCMQAFDDIEGVITVDSDGQHLVPDVIKIKSAMAAYPEALVLGCREFGEDTPKRSIKGNRFTSKAMRLMYGIELEDTQTGLRGIPKSMLHDMSVLSGKRYEYELNMLIYAKKRKRQFVTVPIKTVYFDNNSGSHYRTIADSARIFGRLCSGIVTFSASAMCSGTVDVIIYYILVEIILKNLPLSVKLLIACLTARAVSSTINFLMNRKIFRVTHISSAFKYYILLFSQLAVSYLSVWQICQHTNANPTLTKVIVDCMLALISYQVQLRWVFKNPMQKEEAH